MKSKVEDRMQRLFHELNVAIALEDHYKAAGILKKLKGFKPHFSPTEEDIYEISLSKLAPYLDRY